MKRALDIFDRLNPQGANASGPSTLNSQLSTSSDEGGDPCPCRFVMCRPAYLSTAIANNVFMKGQKVDVKRAQRQFVHITRMLRALGVTVLEIPPTPGAQDQTYTANIAVAIPSPAGKGGNIVLANYKAPGRAIEEAPAREFFESMGYNVIRPATKFEGEADFKRWKDGVFFGGWGKFSDRATMDWISQKCGIQVIPIRETSDELYHLDCSLFVLDEETFLVNRDGMDAASFRTLENLGNVIPVPADILSCGVTNCVRIPGKPLLMSGMHFPEVAQYQKAMDWMYEQCDRLGLSVFFVDIDEADKSGADVSCQVMHLPFLPS